MLASSPSDFQVFNGWDNELIFVTFFLRIDYLLFFNPFVLLFFFLVTFSLLFYGHQSLHFEIIFLRAQYFRLHHCLWFVLRFVFWFQLKAFFVDSAFENSFNYAVFRDILECSTYDIVINNSPFFLRVIVGARTFFTSFNLTFDCFVERWVILLFLPSMAHIAVESYLASTVVVGYRDIVLRFPVDARLNNKNGTIA